MENKLENKAKFFAQYYGQEVLSDGNNIATVEKDAYNWSAKVFHLSLKPLSSITDEDAIEVAKLAISFNSAYVERTSETKSKCVIDSESWLNQFSFRIERVIANVYVYQALQQKGYALPYMGLSVEKLIEYGWIKLN